jgi:sugar lactone lactonase YvrE
MRAWYLLVLAACSDRPLYLPDATDLATRERSMPDLAAPDLGVPDLAARDLAAPDLALATPDLATPDLSTADLGPRDLAPPPLCQLVTVSTLAGNGKSNSIDGTGGPNGSAEFYYPNAVTVDHAGVVYVGDSIRIYRANNPDGTTIRRIATDGTTTTLGGRVPVNGEGFNGSYGLAVDGNGTLWVADASDSVLRTVAADGTTTTLPDLPIDGVTFDTSLAYPHGIFVAANGTLYVGDSNNARVLEIVPGVSAVTLAGNISRAGEVDGTGGRYGTASLGVFSVVLDGAGNVVFTGGHGLRKIAPDGTTTTLNTNRAYGLVDGTAAEAEFYEPEGLAIDAAGTFYVVDGFNHAIRRVAADGTTTTLAGNGSAGFADGVGCDARFNYPINLAVFGKQIFVADSQNNRIRKLQLP